MSCVMYSTNCPKCRVLETKMNQKGIKFDLVTDIDIMQEKGFLHAPNLEVDGQIYDFSEAIKLVNTYDNDGDFELFVTSRESE